MDDEHPHGANRDAKLDDDLEAVEPIDGVPAIEHQLK